MTLELSAVLFLPFDISIVTFQFPPVVAVAVAVAVVIVATRTINSQIQYIKKRTIITYI